MRFRLRSIVGSIDLKDTVFECKSTSGIRLTLTPRDVHESKPVPFSTNDAICEVLCDRELTPRLRAAAVQSGQLSIRKEAVGAAINELSLFQETILNLIRWRLGSAASLQMVRCTLGEEWSTDGVAWMQVADNRFLEIRGLTSESQWSDAIAQSIIDAQAAGLHEPFGHELWLEAAKYIWDSPRTAVVVAVIAAEVGFKQFAIQLNPNSKWLTENVPSPPLIQMLVEYLPLLPVKLRLKDQPITLPQTLLTTLQKAISLRNQLVHGRLASVDWEPAKDALVCVRELLYWLDLYSGVRWAAERFDASRLPLS